MSARSLRVLAGLGLAVALGATAAWSQPAAKLVITGSTTMTPLVSEMVPRFKALHPGVEVELRSGGSGRGVSDLRAGASDIAMVSRPLLDSERDLFAFPLARDGVALIVHRDNPVKALTAEQAKGLFTGKITNWKAVGGRNAAVVLIWRTKGQGSGELLAEHMNFLYADVRAQATIVENEAVIGEVGNNANAIAPVSVGESERRARDGARIKLLAFGGSAASSKTIRNGSYALARPLALVTRRLPEGPGKRFIDFALSAHVADLFARHEFVPYQE